MPVQSSAVAVGIGDGDQAHDHLVVRARQPVDDGVAVRPAILRIVEPGRQAGDEGGRIADRIAMQRLDRRETHAQGLDPLDQGGAGIDEFGLNDRDEVVVADAGAELKKVLQAQVL